MNQLPDSARILTVSNINNYIKSLLAYDTNLAGIYVSGEISNFKIYNSGHAYFSLKDTNGKNKSSIEFIDKGREIQEFDVLLVKNNKVYIFECKILSNC